MPVVKVSNIVLNINYVSVHKVLYYYSFYFIGVIQTDSSSDEESSEAEEDSDLEHEWGELDADAETTDESTKRCKTNSVLLKLLIGSISNYSIELTCRLSCI